MVVQIEGIVELLIYAALMILGAVLSVVVPYAIKVWVDPSIEFDKKYLVVLMFSIVMVVFFGLPDAVGVVNVGVIKLAIITGYGLSAMVRDFAKGIIDKGEAGKPGG